ncbi:flagellar assembly protein FliW [Curtobacterium sp. MCSS17_016]|uniref:flagellar assembly protein FliW n=1 Tax=Curtobacterium sp. MCSS17_016 TaxID=2175644 RepID=UPI000DA751CD|nr:flagellar assembly protein FliW [Curtobacterium sp. MCSS17_016]WIE80926.1 flagellar assembly protein FliW [Curtobacterium sp. MCSS17_016]
MTNLLFTTPLAGLDQLRNYTLTLIEGAAGVYSLESTERPEIRFHVLDAATHAPTYRPSFPGYDESKHTVLLIVTPRDGGLTVNLLAPVILDVQHYTAQQVILDDPARYPLQAPVAELVAA